MKRIILVCLFGGLPALCCHAAEEGKSSSPQTAVASAKPNEAVGKITAAEPIIKVAPKKKAKWSNPNLDLTHCLNRESNIEVIKCAH